MTEPHCAIRFTGTDGSVDVHVARDCYGHPEDVLTNLHQLSKLLAAPSDPRVVATQFVIADSLTLGYQELGMRNLVSQVVNISDPDRDGHIPESMRHHRIESIPDPKATIWCYELVIADEPDKWTIRIGEPSESKSHTAAELFDDVSWQYEGRLADALAKL